MMPLGYHNVYVQAHKPRRVSPPHATRALADRAAERVYRATGGACVRVDVVELEVDRGRLIEAC